MKQFKQSMALKWGCGVMAGVLAPGVAFGCACGCGIFDVGTSSTLPGDEGGTAFLNYAFVDQRQNWSDSSQSAAVNNPDKHIRTDFFTPGVQYMFDRSWGVRAELPFAYRAFSTTSDSPGNPVHTIKWTAQGDLSVKGIYTGFSDDLSSGIDFGLKLPTGDFSKENSYHDVDRDTEIGSGSTDLLLGGFHRGHLDHRKMWDWFVQGELDVPTLTQGDFRPGTELDAAAGIDYSGWQYDRAGVSPLLQLIGSERTKDYGADANSPNSGYTRVLVAPGLEVHVHPVSVYADVEVPVFQHVNGNQLIAPLVFRVNVSVTF